MEKFLNDSYYQQVRAKFTSFISIVIKNASINFKKKNARIHFSETEYNDENLKDTSLSIGNVSFFYDNAIRKFKIL